MSEAKEVSKRKEIFHIIEREGIDPIWTRVGIAFVNRDDSLNLYLDLMPMNGRLHVRDPRPPKTQRKESV